SALAAVMFNKIDFPFQNAVCVVSGGNIDSNVLKNVMTRGLIKLGKLMEVSVSLVDRPGELETLLQSVKTAGGKVSNIRFDRENQQSEVSRFIVHLTIEADGPKHCEEIRGAIAR
ncbi:threonine ammonia-lyase, partial [Christensenellaceae bacterium OttesenSCG-928-M15]|nr:threonine ammonia-lyase [Christensenellaceae bacterium OttesenSCG-928-M15]